MGLWQDGRTGAVTFTTQPGSGKEKYFITADPLDGSSLVDANLAIGTIIGIHNGDDGAW